MGNFIIDIQLADNRVSSPVQLKGNLIVGVQLDDNTLRIPVVLGFPEAPTLSEFDFDFDSPMA